MDSVTAPLTEGETEWRKCLPLLILAGLLAYCNSFDKALVYDDLYWITNNADIGSLSRNLTRFANRPLIGVSLTLNYGMGGTAVFGYHVVNLMVHLGSALALFGIVRRTLLLERWRGQYERAAPWLALCVALLWMVHPLQTQAVTYVIQRCESMMGLFYLLTIYTSIRALGATGRWAWGSVAVLCCALSMACKEVAATAPVVVVLYDWTFLPQPFLRTLRQRWPLYAGLVTAWLGVYLISPWLLVGVVQAPGDTGAAATAGFGYRGITPLQYLFTQAGVLLHYLRLSVWPAPLCLHSEDWPVARSFRDALVPGSVVLALLVGTAWALLRRSWLGFVGAWFFVILAPSSSIIPIRDVAVEHRMYLPLAAVVVLAVLPGYAVLRRTAVADPARGPRLFALASVVVGLAALALTISTLARNTVYQSPLAMWADNHAKRPDDLFAHRSLGIAYIKAGRLDEGLHHLLAVERVTPEDPLVQEYLGECYLFQDQLPLARAHYETYLRLDPGEPECHNNLGFILRLQGERERSAHHFREAVRLEPGSALYHRNLACALWKLDRRAEAFGEFRISLQREPDWPEKVAGGMRPVVLGGTRGRAPHVLADAVFNLEMACLVTEYRNPEILDTLAAAYAVTASAETAAARNAFDAGRFHDALGHHLAAASWYGRAAATAEQGRTMARQMGQAEWALALEEHARLYRDGRCLEPPEDVKMTR